MGIPSASAPRTYRALLFCMMRLLVPVKVLFELLQGVGFQAWLQLAVEVGGIVSVVLVQDAIKLENRNSIKKGVSKCEN